MLAIPKEKTLLHLITTDGHTKVVKRLRTMDASICANGIDEKI